MSDQEKAALHEWSLKRLAPTDVYAFGEYVFGYEAAEHHREMVDAINAAISTRTNTVILEPRGGAKTTWGNTINLTKLIADNPDIRIGLISNTAKQANDFSRAIRWTLESNPKLHDVYGNLVSTSKWTDVEWLRKDSRWHGSKDVTLYAAGAGGAIISKRFDIILCDDILDEEKLRQHRAARENRELVLQDSSPVPGSRRCCGGTWHTLGGRRPLRPTSYSCG